MRLGAQVHGKTRAEQFGILFPAAGDLRRERRGRPGVHHVRIAGEATGLVTLRSGEPRRDVGGRVDGQRPTRQRCPSTRTTDVPPGFAAAQRDEPGGFTGDPDVMDTSATGVALAADCRPLGRDPELFGRVFHGPAPQAHEIIRTWCLLRAHVQHDSLP